MAKTNSHESTIRSVVGFAREVRIHMRDSRVIFGTVVALPNPMHDCFGVRAWGLTEVTAISFDAVLRAVPVKQMVWEKQRLIAAAQLAGVFTGPSPRTGDAPRSLPEPAPSPTVTEVISAS